VKKTILIAPFEGPLASAVAGAARGAGWSTALATAPRPSNGAGGKAAEESGGQPELGAGGLTGQGGGADTAALPYDPASYVSASALLAATLAALGDIDAAVIVADRSAASPDFAAARAGELAAFVGARCAGPLYLARELARHFEARKSGKLLLLTSEPPRDAALGPLSALAGGAFEGLGKGLFSAAEGSGWAAFGVVDATGEADRAARYALELLEDPRASKAGRWLRFTGKGGFFG